MKKYIYLSIVATALFSFMVNAQVVITDDTSNTTPTIKENISLMLESVNKDKGLIIPIIANNTSVANIQDGMFAYKKDEECFVFFKDGAVSSCIIENKADRTINITTSDPINVNNSTSYSNIPVNSGNNTFTLAKRSLITITVYGSHQYATAAPDVCAYQQLGLFVNGTQRANMKHRSMATARGNIYPSQMTWVRILNPGTYTVTFQHKSNNSSCSPTASGLNRYTSVSAQVVIKEVY